MNIILSQKNVILLTLIIIIYTSITVFIQNKIIMSIFKLKKESFKNIWIIQILTLSIISIVFPVSTHKILKIVVETILYKKGLKITIEKSLFAISIREFIMAILELSIIKILTELFGITSFKFAIESEHFLISFNIIFILAVWVIYLCIKKLKISINIPDVLSKYSKKQIIEISTVSTFLTVVDETIVLKCVYNLPNSIYLLDILLLFSYCLIGIINMLKTLQIEADKNAINNLESSNDRLQHNYDDICAFRHDIGNIMQGIGGYIATKDLEGLQKMYNDVICECQEMNNIKAFDKSVINNPAVYNLINSKYLIAKNRNIQLKLEVYIDFNTLKIKTYELCRILGVLLDNAIEAADECENKMVSIKFIKDSYNNRNLVVIENTCKNYLVDMSKMKEKGFTTKKNKLFHGLGLWKVNQIVKKNENLILKTTRDKTFKQQLEIYSWE